MLIYNNPKEKSMGEIFCYCGFFSRNEQYCGLSKHIFYDIFRF